MQILMMLSLAYVYTVYPYTIMEEAGETVDYDEAMLDLRQKEMERFVREHLQRAVSAKVPAINLRNFRSYLQ
jgi:hypothetical protein